MKFIGDFHTHTKWCGHAEGEMVQYVEKACELGLPAIGFCAHFPVDIPFFCKVQLDPEEVELFVEEARRLKESHDGGIEILMGFEVDFVEGGEEYVEKECIGRWSPDYVMGSIHMLGDWMFDHPDCRGEYEGRDITEMYRTYYGLLVTLVRTGLFDVVGHMDLVKKFGYRPEGDVTDVLDELLDAVAGRGMLLDVNTAGIDKPVEEIYPASDILRSAAERNIGLITGSDAHAPGEVGRYFDQALTAIQEAGYINTKRTGALTFYSVA